MKMRHLKREIILEVINSKEANENETKTLKREKNYDINRKEKNVIFASALWSIYSLFFHFGIPLIFEIFFPELLQTLEGNSDLYNASIIFILFFYFSYFNAIFGAFILAFHILKCFNLNILF